MARRCSERIARPSCRRAFVVRAFVVPLRAFVVPLRAFVVRAFVVPERERDPAKELLVVGDVI
jgi:hypothetical protein